MPQRQPVTKAELREIVFGDGNDNAEINSEKTIMVQFNPQTLKLSYSNQVKGDSQKGGSSIQFVGRGTTKLSFEMWFDITVPLPEGTGDEVGDVRILTEKVKYFITPQGIVGNNSTQDKCVPPAVRFIWGSFHFDGIVESMNENLEFFSNDGRPLRANISLSIVSQEIFEFKDLKKGSQNTSTPGTQPLTPAKEKDNISKMAAQNGQLQNWKLIAAANKIENPLRLKPGALINLNARTNYL